MLLSGRTQDYIRCAVRRYGPLIFVIAHPTCQIEGVVAIHPCTAWSPEFRAEFDLLTQRKLLDAARRVTRECTPVVCDRVATEYITGDPELELDVAELYTL